LRDIIVRYLCIDEHA